MSNIECAFFGVLGRDGEAKTSKAGKPYLRLNMRVGDGESAVWVGVMAFDTKAIEAADKMVKGARVYCEGSLRLDEWTAQDGSAKHGLSVMSWHCRLPQIGRNKPRRERDDAEERPKISAAAPSFYDDPIPF
jgi:single-stranded DNA-binding protein